MTIQTPLTPKLAELFEHGTLQTYGKGEIILRTDIPPPGVFCVAEGYVKVYSLTDNGDENLHIIYGPDMIFPIIWAITGRLRQVFYEAMDDVSLRRISRENFLTFIDTDTENTKAVLYQVVDMLNANANRMDNLEYTRSYSRIVYRLITLAERYGELHGSGLIIKAPVKHHDIANSTNCSRETVSREMEKLEKEGLISHQDHFFVITDIESLKKKLLRA